LNAVFIFIILTMASVLVAWKDVVPGKKFGKCIYSFYVVFQQLIDLGFDLAYRQHFDSGPCSGCSLLNWMEFDPLA